MPEISALSNETVWQRFKYVHPITGSADVTDYDVELAIVPLGAAPGDADWYAATWEATAEAGWYLARLELGPDSGSVTLEAGTVYNAWLRLTLPTETPIVRGPDEITAY